MTVAIVGFGRFGRLLKTILDKEHQVVTFDSDTPLDTLHDCEHVFLCVPIRLLETTLHKITPYLAPHTTVIDTCSVKVYPVACMQRLLPKNIAIIATHPLFGPDSYREEYTNRIMMHPIRQFTDSYLYW